MFLNFARRLFEILISDEFSYVRQTDNRLVYETEALSLYKDKGSILYIVTIIDAEKLPLEKYEAMTARFSGLLDDENRASVVIFNVVANDSEGRFSFPEDYAPGKKSYVFSYNVDLESRSIHSPAGQPELLGMRNKIEAAAAEYGEEYVNGTHLESLESELSQKYALPLKSKNIRLTLFLIALNIVLWALLEVSGGSSNIWTLSAFGAVSRNSVVMLNEYYRLFTAMFLHIGIAHLANNCLALYIFGSRVEKHFGKFNFIIIYITAGIVGNAVSVLFLTGLSAGASGAIFGLLGALLSVAYRTGRSVSSLSPYVILLLCVASIGMGFINPVVNNYAHVAGFFTGVLLGRATFKKA